MFKISINSFPASFPGGLKRTSLITIEAGVGSAVGVAVISGVGVDVGGGVCVGVPGPAVGVMVGVEVFVGGEVGAGSHSSIRLISST